ncbi:MAG TPA: HlyD family secretion protein [Steroidobacteraceae bacterium]|jgi:membrane fusion protein (multidrug efflux system)|nr:HlyD family secretion protein [Steroidobacteraceae bacterium]
MSESKFDLNRIFEIFWRALVFLVAIAIIVIVTTNWTRWEGGKGWQKTDDAYLQADLTPIAARVAGYVRELPVQDYERVHEGQVIAQLVDDDYRAAVAQAEANVAAAVAQGQALHAQLELQGANVDAARAVIASTTASSAQNSRDLVRQQRLFETGSSSTEASEKLETAHAQLNAQLQQNTAQAHGAQRQLSVLNAQLAQNDAAQAAARAALDTARINLGYTTIVATQDGVIGLRQVKPGQLVAVGSQITTLSPLPDIWVIANYKETQLTHMAVGQRAEITVDSFPGHTLRGHLQAFAPASGAEFALLPPDNATGNFTKVVQRLAVKILIDDADGLADRLVPGMSVETRVDAQAPDTAAVRAAPDGHR